MVHGLLVRLVGLVVLLAGHVGALEEVPRLGILRVGLEGLGEVLDREVLVLEGGAVLVVQPVKLLEHIAPQEGDEERAHLVPIVNTFVLFLCRVT